jgi:hypothetical protein
MTDKRASIFASEEPKTEQGAGIPEKLDLTGFTPRATHRPVDKKIMEDVATESGFQSREPKEIVVHSTNSLRKKVTREDQLSTRIQRQHYELFYKIVNATGKKNAEIIEQALEAYAKELGIE